MKPTHVAYQVGAPLVRPAGPAGSGFQGEDCMMSARRLLRTCPGVLHDHAPLRIRCARLDDAQHISYF